MAQVASNVQIANPSVIPSRSKMHAFDCINKHSRVWGGGIILNYKSSSVNEESTKYIVRESRADQAFVTNREEIIRQYNKQKNHWDLPLGAVLSESLKTLNSILSYFPHAVSVELLTDNAALFIFKIEDYSFFLQQILVQEDDDDDEAILSVYHKKDKFPSHAGKLLDIFDAISMNLEII